jgi:hypothetical protein
MSVTVVFVHGWSVTNLDTYGALPLRLREEGKLSGIDIRVEEIFLGRYISFHDEVRVPDISRAFDAAVKQQLQPGTNFVCITHSTGGPVIRDWWNRYYANGYGAHHLSHLIMLAPANFGSALAQLGKAKISRMKSWFEGVEPGQGVLNWLELGSGEGWMLNEEWIKSGGTQISETGTFPFVLTGEYIDRKFYDNLNSYTGELGSDGVVRAAAANLNGRYLELTQTDSSNGILAATNYKEAPRTAFRIVSHKAHSGDTMGIMKSVQRNPAEGNSTETVTAILNCIKVTSKADYMKLCDQFAVETEQVQRDEFLEIEKSFLSRRLFLHDKFSMIIFRVRDDKGYSIPDFDLLLTGAGNDPNKLPEGFFADRQRNLINKETITYFLNYHAMHGTSEVKDPKNGETVRKAIVGTDVLGIHINPRPDDGFVRYAPCMIPATKELCDMLLNPNGTILVDIRLKRIVSSEVMQLVPLGTDAMPTKKQGDFSKTKPGTGTVE